MTPDPRLPVHPLDPDPLSVSDDPWADGYFEGWEVGFRAARNRRPAIVAVVAAAISGAVVATTLLLAGHVLAASRSGLQSGDSFSAGRSEAPQTVGDGDRSETRGSAPVVAPDLAPASSRSGGGASSVPPLAAPTQFSDGGGISSALVAGTASFVGPTFGARYLALPEGPGVTVRICSRSRCVVRTSTDAGPDRAMQRKGRVADVSFLDFKYLCRCSPYLVGLIRVTVEGAGGLPTPPATSTEDVP